MDDTTHTYEFGESTSDPGPVPHLRSKIALALLAAVAIVLALIGIDVAVISGAQQAPARPVIQVVKLSGSQSVQPVVDLSVSPAVKPGPDGKLHDAFSVTNFTVHAGLPVKLIINNTDDATHSIVSPGAGVRILVRPGVHTYTLLVRSQGHFEWYCMQPCDPYSMDHLGYMRGYITSV